MQRIVECTREMHSSGGPGLFILGDAQQEMAALCERFAGQVQLIYLDPPFGTGETFQVRLGRSKPITLCAYADTLSQADYFSMMRAVLSGCHTLLSPTGSLYLHVDYRMSARLRMLLDELFGASHFVNEIIWMYRSGGRSRKHFARKHDTILLYRKSAKQYFNIDAVGIPRGPERRNHMKRSVDADGRVCFSIRSGGKVYTYYEDTPIFPTDVWTDIEHLHQRDPERVGYATQKPEALLRRIVLASSQPGDLIADFFCGSGTTAAVAARLGRRFLTCDCSPIAMHVLRRRLLAADNAVSLLDQAQPLTLEFPAEAGGAWALDAACGPDFCTLRACSCDGEENPLLAYCALGTLRDGLFTPHAHAFYPQPPFTLQAQGLDAPVLQVVLANGRQAFYRCG